MALIDFLDNILATSVHKNMYDQNNTYSNSNGGPLKQVNQGNQSDYIPGEGNIRNNQYSDRFTDQFAPIAGSLQGTNGILNQIDVFAIANWLRTLNREFGIENRKGQSSRNAESIVKGATFLASQFMLTALNPTDFEVGGIANAIYNPLHVPLSAVPIIRTTTTIGSPTVAAALSLVGDVYSSRVGDTVAAGVDAGIERLLLMRQGYYVGDQGKGFLGDTVKAGAQNTLQSPNVSTPVSIEAQNDQTGMYAIIAKNSNIHLNLYTSENKYSDHPILDQSDLEALSYRYSPSTANPSKTKLTALFRQKDPSKASTYEWKAKTTTLDNKFSVSDIPNDLRAVIGTDEDEDGTVSLSKQEANDSRQYLPFSFQDLREQDKLLYFRAFLRPGFSENFTPDWQTDRYYGRVDRVPTYIGTDRTINLSFDVVAWDPTDLPVMWKKLHRLQSMVYPEFDNRLYLKSGPLIRMRVGDLFASSIPSSQNDVIIKKGLPGYLTSLNFDYEDTLFNMKQDFKIPRKVLVTISFTVVHEGNPGIYPINDWTIQQGVFTPGNPNRTFGAPVLEIPEQQNTSQNNNTSQRYKIRDGAIRGIMTSINSSPSR